MATLDENRFSGKWWEVARLMKDNSTICAKRNNLGLASVDFAGKALLWEFCRKNSGYYRLTLSVFDQDVNLPVSAAEEVYNGIATLNEEKDFSLVLNDNMRDEPLSLGVYVILYTDYDSLLILGKRRIKIDRTVETRTINNITVFHEAGEVANCGGADLLVLARKPVISYRERDKILLTAEHFCYDGSQLITSRPIILEQEIIPKNNNRSSYASQRSTIRSIEEDEIKEEERFSPNEMPKIVTTKTRTIVPNVLPSSSELLATSSRSGSPPVVSSSRSYAPLFTTGSSNYDSIPLETLKYREIDPGEYEEFETSEDSSSSSRYVDSPLMSKTRGKTTRIIEQNPSLTKRTRVIEEVPVNPQVTRRTRVIEEVPVNPQVTKKTRVIEEVPVNPQVTRRTRVIEEVPISHQVTNRRPLFVEEEPIIKRNRYFEEEEPIAPQINTKITRAVEEEPISPQINSRRGRVFEEPVNTQIVRRTRIIEEDPINIRRVRFDEEEPISPQINTRRTRAGEEVPITRRTRVIEEEQIPPKKIETKASSFFEDDFSVNNDSKSDIFFDNPLSSGKTKTSNFLDIPSKELNQSQTRKFSGMPPPSKELNRSQTRKFSGMPPPSPSKELNRSQTRKFSGMPPPSPSKEFDQAKSSNASFFDADNANSSSNYRSSKSTSKTTFFDLNDD